MHSLTQNFLNRLVFSASEASSLRALGEYRGKQALFSRQSPETLNSLLMLAKVESVESSNRLEGIELPPKKVEELVLQGARPTNRSEQEIAGYRDVLNLIHESAKEIPFNSNTILQLHGILSRYMPNPGGHWKMNDNEIIEKYSDGTQRVRFTPVKAFLTGDAVRDLTRTYQESLNSELQDPLVIIPLSILDFLCIHPFSDGNGRISRLLTLLLLYHFDYQVGRYISLERIFEENKTGYYESLEASSKFWHEGVHDPKPWLNYFWGMLIRAYREFEERVGVVSTIRGSKTEFVRIAINRRLVPFSINDIASECLGVSRDMIRRVLRQMKEEGLLTTTSSGRGALWRKVNT